MNLADLIDRNAAFAPNKIALRFEGRTLTYAAFAARIAATANALATQCGITRGDRIAILSANRPDYLVLLYACAKLGAVMVPLNWRLAIPELKFMLQDADAKVLVAEQTFAEAAASLKAALPSLTLVRLDEAPPQAALPDAMSFDTLLAKATGDATTQQGNLNCPLLLVYTSGTTGRPKGAVLRQDALLWNGAMSQHMHGLNADDHVLTVLPLFHVGGLNIQTTPALHAGATVTLQARFAPNATLAAIAEDRPTLTVLVPATIQAIVEHPAWASANLSSLRALTTGSTQVPQHLVDAMEARGALVLQVYGSTETCPVAVYTRLGGDLRAGSTGLPGLHCEARIVDDAGRELPHGEAGEVVVRGPQVFTEYWRDAEATREGLRDGWYHSGDIGTRDAEGYFFIHDRKKNMIISGGENIYAAEVERVLLTHPAVAEAAVIGRADPKWQEVPVAYVVCRKGHAADTDDILRHAGEQLARFKVPREILFVDSLPRNALGKVQHFRLRERTAQTRESA